MEEIVTLVNDHEVGVSLRGDPVHGWIRYTFTNFGNFDGHQRLMRKHEALKALERAEVGEVGMDAVRRERDAELLALTHVQRELLNATIDALKVRLEISEPTGGDET